MFSTDLVPKSALLAIPISGRNQSGTATFTFACKISRSYLYTPSPQRYREETAMGILRTFDRRKESRISAHIVLMVWGVDTQGERFLQEAHARDISLGGALLSGIDAELRSGDVVGILYGSRKARFRVVWVRYDEAGDKMQVAVHRIEPDVCPWRDLLVEETAETAAPAEIRPFE